MLTFHSIKDNQIGNLSVISTYPKITHSRARIEDNIREYSMVIVITKYYLSYERLYNSPCQLSFELYAYIIRSGVQGLTDRRIQINGACDSNENNIIETDMTVTAIYKVAFKEPPIPDDDRKEFFFSSLSAIYDTFTPEQVGCKVTRLWNIGISQGNLYTGKLCQITREPLTSKTQISPSKGSKSGQ